MSVWGFGAYYIGEPLPDKSQEFLDNEYVYIGWSKEQAPALHQMLRAIKVGDIIYIKKFMIKTKQLHVKAVGIVTDNDCIISGGLGTGIKVKWSKKYNPIAPIYITPEIYRNNVFNNSIYEEYNEEIINKLVDAIME